MIHHNGKPNKIWINQHPIGALSNALVSFAEQGQKASDAIRDLANAFGQKMEWKIEMIPHYINPEFMATMREMPLIEQTVERAVALQKKYGTTFGRTYFMFQFYGIIPLRLYYTKAKTDWQNIFRKKAVPKLIIDKQ